MGLAYYKIRDEVLKQKQEDEVSNQLEGNQKKVYIATITNNGNKEQYVLSDDKNEKNYKEDENNKFEKQKSLIQRALTNAFFQYIDGKESVPEIISDNIETYEGLSLDRINPTKIKESIEKEKDPNRKQELIDLLNVYRLLEANQYQTDFQNKKQILQEENDDLYLQDPSKYFDGKDILDHFHSQPEINKHALKLYRNVVLFNFADRKLGNVCLRKGSNEGEEVELVDIDFDIFAYYKDQQNNPLFDDSYKYNDKLKETLKNIFEPSMEICNNYRNNHSKNGTTDDAYNNINKHKILNTCKNVNIFEQKTTIPKTIKDIIIDPLKKMYNIIYETQALSEFVVKATKILYRLGINQQTIKKEITSFLKKIKQSYENIVYTKKDIELAIKKEIECKNGNYSKQPIKEQEKKRIINSSIENNFYENGTFSVNYARKPTEINKQWKMEKNKLTIQAFRMNGQTENEIMEHMKKQQEQYQKAFSKEKTIIEAEESCFNEASKWCKTNLCCCLCRN